MPSSVRFVGEKSCARLAVKTANIGTRPISSSARLRNDEGVVRVGVAVGITVAETVWDPVGDNVLVSEVREVSETRAVDDAKTDNVAVNALDAVLSADGVKIDEIDAIDENVV